jgi:hypothetical protein
VELSSSFTQLAPCSRCFDPSLVKQFAEQVEGVTLLAGAPRREIVHRGPWYEVETPDSFHTRQRERLIELECGHQARQLYFERAYRHYRCARDEGKSS